MKKVLSFLLIAAVGFWLASPAWAETPDSDELQALRDEIRELKSLLQNQQERIQTQDWRLQQQERKILDLEESAEEPVPYANYEEIVERVKAELPQPQDGFTLGGGKIRVTPYGFIRLDAAYDDSANFIFSGNVVGFALPEGGAGNKYPNADESFAVTATATRLGLNFDGPDFAGGDLRGKIEIDFDELSGWGGDVVAHRIRMRHAYAEMLYPTWSLLAGQTWDVIAPRIPYMLDCVVMWGSGNVGYRRPQIRLTKWWDVDGSKLTGQVSLNHQDRSLSDNRDGDVNLLDGVESGWPLGEARLGLDTVIFGDRKLSLGISGMIGEDEIDSPAPGDKNDLNVWLVALDGSVTVIPGLLTVQGEIWTGENTDNVYGGIVQGLVKIGDKYEELEAYGGFIHAMLTPREDLKFNLGFGMDQVDNKDDLRDPAATATDALFGGSRTRNVTYFGNVIWTVVPNVDVGLELAWHETDWVGKNDGDLFRIQTAFTYKF